jgi:hypothetical protein
MEGSRREPDIEDSMVLSPIENYRSDNCRLSIVLTFIGSPQATNKNSDKTFILVTPFIFS